MNGFDIAEKYGIADVGTLKNLVIDLMKKEGSQRIQTIDGKSYDDLAWTRKSQNFQDAKLRYFDAVVNGDTPGDDVVSAYREASAALERKDRFVERINKIEVQINEMSPEDLNNFDFSEEINWENLSW